ncbi:alpha/beta fold hydrolase [Muriicola sp. E247]|uniref:alpha/beta fold hydrolase n=1 Tax=Muriicola sp. E247 TaxID=3242730 RepID=UPI0035243E4D
MRNLLLSIIAFSLLVNSGCRNISSNKEAPVIQSEEQYLNLGGVEQYIEIYKSADNNPVLLLVHGGPAWPQTPQFRYLHKEIANKFTVVLWEQRGAGKSYLKNKTPGNISLDQIIDDGQELIKIIKDKLNVEKIYLAGYSWGSIVGLKMVEENPADFYAYIGIAQLINKKRGMEISKDWLRENDTIHKDIDAIAVLDSLDNNLIPDNQEAGMKLYQLVYKYGGAVYNQEAGIEVEKAQNHYDDYKNYDWYGVYRYSSQFLADDLFSTDFRSLKKLRVPVYLILGRHDWNVPSVLALEWYENLDAPEKKIIWMENTAHGTLDEDPDDFKRIMLEMILP